LIINSNVTLQAGSTTRIKLNKAANTNDQLRVVGTLAYGGTLVITNVSGTLVDGDTFALFNADASSGNFAAIVNQTGSSGVNFSFNPATGMLSVEVEIPVTPTNITYSADGENITLNWPANYTGWVLQTQTNLLDVGISTNWTDVINSYSTNSVSIPIDPAVPATFFRLRHP
jgi:hypothetical protein